MGRHLKIYFLMITCSIRCQWQYRLSFLLQATGHFLVTIIELFGIWALFHRFGALGSWSVREVIFLYGMVNIAFALSEAGARSFDLFGPMVKNGEFDRILLRPLSPAFQLFANEVQIFRVGRLTAGLVGVILSGALASILVRPGLVILCLAAIFSTALLFSGLFVIQAAICFFTVETLELMNILTYGGSEAGSFPLSIYQRWFQLLFLAVVPLGCTLYLPSLILLGKNDPLWGLPLSVGWISPLAGPIFFLLALFLWNRALRQYQSTGS